MGLEARGDRARRGRRLGAGDGAVQCMAGIVPDLSGDGLADRWRRRGPHARAAGCGDGGVVVRPRLFRARALLDRLRLPRRCSDLRMADAVCDPGSARLSGAIHRAGFRTGATDLDRRRFSRAGARRRTDHRRLAAPPCRSWAAPALALALLLAMGLYGTIRLALQPTRPLANVKLRIMQPDLPQDARFNYAAKAEGMRKYLTLSAR